VNEAVAAAWDKVVEDWQNQTRHDALMVLAVEHKELKFVATKYREKKGDPIADAQLGKITSAALATMLVGSGKKEKDPASSYKRALIWLVVLGLMLVLGLIAAKLMVQGHPAPRP
jgi:hypothetical protein